MTEDNATRLAPSDATKPASSNLTTIARSLGGSTALGLLVAALAPAVLPVTAAAVVGLVAGFLAKNLDNRPPTPLSLREGGEHGFAQILKGLLSPSPTLRAGGRSAKSGMPGINRQEAEDKKSFTTRE